MEFIQNINKHSVPFWTMALDHCMAEHAYRPAVDIYRNPLPDYMALYANPDTEEYKRASRIVSAMTDKYRDHITAKRGGRPPETISEFMEQIDIGRDKDFVITEEDLQEMDHLPTPSTDKCTTSTHSRTISFTRSSEGARSKWDLDDLPEPDGPAVIVVKRDTTKEVIPASSRDEASRILEDLNPVTFLKAWVWEGKEKEEERE